MPSSNVVDPVCPKNYTLQKDRMKYRLCKCIKNTDEKDYESGNRLDTYKKVKRRVTVKKPGKRNRCPSGTRYNKKTGYCEGTTKQSRSLMSVLFKDGQEREVKTICQQRRSKGCALTIQQCEESCASFCLHLFLGFARPVWTAGPQYHLQHLQSVKAVGLGPKRVPRFRDGAHQSPNRNGNE